MQLCVYKYVNYMAFEVSLLITSIRPLSNPGCVDNVDIHYLQNYLHNV